MHLHPTLFEQHKLKIPGQVFVEAPWQHEQLHAVDDQETEDTP